MGHTFLDTATSEKRTAKTPTCCGADIAAYDKPPLADLKVPIM